MSNNPNFDDYLRLFERCIELVQRVPPEHQAKLMQVAECLLARTEACATAGPTDQRRQIAETTLTKH